MESERHKRSRSTRSAVEREDVKIRVSSHAFAEFNRMIDLALAQLEARWAHRAAPNAARVRTILPSQVVEE